MLNLYKENNDNNNHKTLAEMLRDEWMRWHLFEFA